MENLQSCQLGGGSERLASEGKAQDKATELYTTPTHYCTLVMWEMSPFVPVLVLTWRSERKPKKDAGNPSLGSFLTWENVPLGGPMYPTPPHTFVLLVLATLHTSRLLCFVVFWQFSLCICFFNWPGLPFWEASTEILEHTSITEHCTGFPTIIVIVIVIVYQYATKCVKEEAEKWNLRTFTFSQS